MQNRAVLREIDLVAAEHRVDPFPQARLLREPLEQRQRLVGDTVFRIVEKETGRLGSQSPPSLRIAGEELAQVPPANL